jgi:CubicO group peptidase (beta-lactamase class C family)
MRDYMRRLAAFGFTGAAFVQQDDRALLNSGYGLADRARGIAFTESTLFNVASFTKPMTATAVMHLVEHGALSLDTPLSHFFPQAPADKASITIAQLLSHSAGLRRESVGGRQISARDQAVAMMLGAQLASPPGARMSYSNDGYRLLAAIIEIAAGRPYRDVMREIVFARAGMRDAGFIQDSWPADRVATGYNEWKSVGAFTGWGGNPWNRDGSGSIVTDLSGLRAFVEAFTSGRLLAPSSMEAMTSVQAASSEENYGFGWFVTQTTAGEKIVLHGGDNNGYHTEVRWQPAQARIIIVVTTQEQYDDSGNGLGVHKRIIATRLRRALDHEAFELPPASIPFTDKSTLVGVYRLPSGGALTLYVPFDNDPNLWIGANGQDAVNLLQNADAARQTLFARKNEHVMAIAAALGSRDRQALSAALAEDERFVLDGLLSDFDAAANRYGAFLGAELMGTRNEITGDDHVRSYVRLRFERGGYDLGFTWHGADFYETMTDVGVPYACMTPIARTGPNACATFDFVTLYSRAFALEPGRLRFGDLEAVRT